MEKINFFTLSTEEQKLALLSLEKSLKMVPKIIEKDIWLCQVLSILFKMPNRHPMAFKGGTSLSKVYELIDRFSEDVDITLDYRYFPEYQEFGLVMSRNKAAKLRESIKVTLMNYRDQVLIPALDSELKKLTDRYTIVPDESGEKIDIIYTSVLDDSNTSMPYIADKILIELGGRNLTIPNEEHFVETYAAKAGIDVEFPSAYVTVMSPEKTFWEKATLMHVECNRPSRSNFNRLSRHWYDLVKLYESDIGKSAIKNKELLKDVVEHKKVFFHYGYANYDDCLNHKIRLVPEGNALEHLEADFISMCESSMVYDENRYTFDKIIKIVKLIENEINEI